MRFVYSGFSFGSFSHIYVFDEDTWWEERCKYIFTPVKNIFPICYTNPSPLMRSSNWNTLFVFLLDQVIQADRTCGPTVFQLHLCQLLKSLKPQTPAPQKKDIKRSRTGNSLFVLNTAVSFVKCIIIDNINSHPIKKLWYHHNF